MSKHTQGSWSADCTRDDGSFEISVDDGTVICARNAWFSGREESYANARLIASAPRLLAVLHGILKCERGMLGHLFLEGWQEQVIRDAIDEAEGV